MRLSHPQIRLVTIIVLIATLGAVLAIPARRLRESQVEYHRLAAMHAASEKEEEAALAISTRLIELGEGSARIRLIERQSRSRAEYHRSMKLAYADAAAHPWCARPKDAGPPSFISEYLRQNDVDFLPMSPEWPWVKTEAEMP
jgi:hypothetical protein